MSTSTTWYEDGILCRRDVTYANTIIWLKEWHPAIELADGTNLMFYHRLDGPAIEYANGDKSWYYLGKKIECGSTKEFTRIVNLKVFW